MINILFLGNPQVGKSSLVSRFCNTIPSAFYIPTEGIDHSYKVINSKGEKTALQLWDVSGNQTINPVNKFYYQKANVFVVMFSLADYPSFKSVNEWMSRIKSYGDSSAKVILVGSKADLLERAVSMDKIENLKDKYNVSYYELSILKDSSCHQNIIKEIMETPTASVNRNIFNNVAKDFGLHYDDQNHNLEETMTLSHARMRKSHNILDTINTKVKSFVKPSKRDEHDEMGERWRNDLRRIESRFEDELRHLRRELSRVQSRDLDSSNQIDLEEVSNRMWLMSSENDREKDRRIEQLYESFESFKSSIVEEMMQSRKKTKIAFDGAAEETDALKNRVRALEKDMTSSSGSTGSRMKSTRDVQQKPSVDANEEAIKSAIDRLESVSKVLSEETNTLKKKTEHNEERINGLFLFVEKELKQTESHLINELNQKLKDIAELNPSLTEQYQPSVSDINPDFDNMIKELNESIRRCIADTDNFYNHLRQEANGLSPDTDILPVQNADHTFAPTQQELHVQSAFVEDVGEPLGDLRVKNKFVTMSIAIAPSDEELEAAVQDDKENLSDNIQLPNKIAPKFGAKIESDGAILTQRHSNLEKASKSYQEIKNTLSSFAALQNNLRSYKEIPLNLSSPVKKSIAKSSSIPNDEITKIWYTLTQFMKNTKEEIENIKFNLASTKTLNVLEGKAIDAQLSVEDIKDVMKGVQGELREEVALLQRDYEAIFKGLKEMIVGYYEDSLEKINLTRDMIKGIKTREGPNNLFPGEKPHFIEHIPSDITQNGGISPAEDVSFDLKILDRKPSTKLEKEGGIKEVYKRLEKKQIENNISAIEEKLNSFWATTSLLAQRMSKIEDQIEIQKASVRKEKRSPTPLFWV